MEFCVLAKIVLLLSIISVSFHVCIFGISFFVIMADILFMALLIFIANGYCDSWIAKVIVVIAVFGTLSYMFTCMSKNKAYQQNTETTATTKPK